MRYVLLAASLWMCGCDEGPGREGPDGSNDGAAERSLIDATGLVVYRTGDKVPECDLVPLDPLEFGGERIDADVEWSGRLDLVTETLVGGVFQATRGSYRVVYPGSTHVTIHAGKVNVTTAEGTFKLRPGDSYLATTGAEVVFETVSSSHQASFLWNLAGPERPPEFVVIPRGDALPESELGPVGTWEDLDSEVLDGDPQLSGRIDSFVYPETTGTFQSTRGAVHVTGNATDEHGVVRHGTMTMTGSDGVPHELKTGDAFLMRYGTELVWSLDSKRVQVHFWGTVQ